MSTHTGTGSETDANTTNAGVPVGTPTSKESSLSNWAGDYVTDMLGRGQALTNMPYEGYENALTAGPTQNQTNAFAGLAGLTAPTGYTANTNTFDQTAADQYMNPYIASVLNPQLAEMSRQNQIQQVNDNAAFTKAGAYGGGRQAIMNSERNDNMARLQNQATQEGYQKAYNTAFDMFTSDQKRLEDSSQFAAGVDQKNFQNQGDLYNNMLKAGEVERGITQEGLAADYGRFKEERDYPYKQLQWGMGLLNGMPLAAQNTNYQEASGLQQILSNAGGGADVMGLLFDIFSGGGGGDGGSDGSDGFGVDLDGLGDIDYNPGDQEIVVSPGYGTTE